MFADCKLQHELAQFTANPISCGLGEQCPVSRPVSSGSLGRAKHLQAVWAGSSPSLSPSPPQSPPTDPSRLDPVQRWPVRSGRFI